MKIKNNSKLESPENGDHNKHGLANSKLILALDVSSIDEVRSLVSELKGTVDVFKVGSQLFTAFGPAAVGIIHESGSRVFLDLKYHDIPNTVVSAAKEAVKMNVYMFDIHSLGGSNMMCRTIKAMEAVDSSVRPLVFGITILTSMSREDFRDIGISNKVEDQVVMMAKLAKKCGLAGVVASAHEIAKIKESCGQKFLVVTPGIRPMDTVAQDQKRIVTPRQAVSMGSDFIVVGRPILNAKDRLAAAKQIKKEMENNSV